MLDKLNAFFKIKMVTKVTLLEALIATVFLKEDTKWFNQISNFIDLEEVCLLILNLMYCDNKEYVKREIHKIIIQKIA